MRYLSNGIDYYMVIDTEMPSAHSHATLKTYGAITKEERRLTFNECRFYLLKFEEYNSLIEIQEEEFKIGVVRETYKVWTDLALKDICYQGIAFDLDNFEESTRFLYTKLFLGSDYGRFIEEFYKPIIHLIDKNEKYKVTVEEK